MSRSLFEDAYRKFWNRVETISVPRYRLNTYTLCRMVSSVRWHTLGELMVSSELQEEVNLMNSWRIKLFDWGVWIDVLDEYGEDEAWALRTHFVDAIAHFCMFQPSAARDRLARIATNAIHQANLVIDRSYEDKLEEDDPKVRGLHRRKRIEAQLRRIGSGWRSAARLKDALRTVDTDAYRATNENWRNRASHFLAPRFDLGEVQLVDRSIVPWTQMVEQPDGTFRAETVADKKAVRYGFGGIGPLGQRDAHRANAGQYEAALLAHNAYEQLVQEFLTVLPRAPDR